MHSIGLKIEVCAKASLLKFYLVAMVSVKDISLGVDIVNVGLAPP